MENKKKQEKHGMTNSKRQKEKKEKKKEKRNFSEEVWKF